MKAIIDHIPKSTPCRRRSGDLIIPTTITIHNTGNPSSTARNERGWLTNPANKREASFHIVVDEHEVIECIPVNERALHAGTSAGNMTSIGVEICESGNYTKALNNAALLVAAMLRERAWGVDRLRRHWDWSRKICPRLMYDAGKWTGWIAFIGMVDKQLKGEQSPPSKEDENTLELSTYQRQMLVEGLQALLDQDVINDASWLEKAKNGTLTVSELTWLNFTLIANK